MAHPPSGDRIFAGDKLCFGGSVNEKKIFLLRSQALFDVEINAIHVYNIDSEDLFAELEMEKEMALRNIREYGDDVLAKECRAVKEITPRVKELVDDMLDTMYEANGVGLAAPQVGVLKRIVVIDVSPEGDQPLIMINPDGEQTGYEGCLSLPGKSGVVTRPNYVKAKATDIDGTEYIVEGEELLARAICHELDHLDGHMYVEKVEGDLVDNEDLVAQQEKEHEEAAD